MPLFDNFYSKRIFIQQHWQFNWFNRYTLNLCNTLGITVTVLYYWSFLDFLNRYLGKFDLNSFFSLVFNFYDNRRNLKLTSNNSNKGQHSKKNIKLSRVSMHSKSDDCWIWFGKDVCLINLKEVVSELSYV